MSKAAKRQRQKERKAERQRIEARIERRRKGLKIGAYLAVVAVIAAGTLIILRVSQSDSKKKATTCAPTQPVPSGSPALEIDPKAKYTATIETTEGTMVTELDACTQLWGANNFVSLARKGFYDGLTFHRAVKGSVIQGGDPQGNGLGGPGYQFLSELPAKGYAVGDLAYAKTDQDPPGTAGSQFFVITSQQTADAFSKEKPFKYGQFGKLTNGLDVARKISNLAPESGDGKPTTEVKIVKITIDGPTVAPTTTAPATTAPGPAPAPAPEAPTTAAP